MKLLVLFFFFYITSAYSQQTIDKLNSNQLKLPKESVSKALILDATGQVKSSSTITDTELSYLDGLTNTITSLLSGKANDTDVVKLTTDQSISGTKTFTGKLVASSTVNGSVPCPVMTETQRNAFTAAQGDCVFNSTSLKLTIYDGAVWKDAGGAGGVSLWLTANPYIINDVVIESDRIYRCLVAHTSGTFATDLAASRWVEVSASPATPYSLANGGTNKALTASNGGVVWVDADSFEILAPGTSGQILQSNAAAAPSWVNKSISAKSDNAASVTLEEIQVANNQLTQTATNKHRVELGNSNILVNPSFEHSTFSTGWTNSAGTFTEETALEIDGLKAAKLVLSAQAMSLTQSSTLYASQFADGGTQGLAMVRVKSTIALKVCAIQAGVVSTSLCVDVPAHNKWGLYKVPFILGATSNGISIASSGNVTGTVYVDEGFLGAVDLSATQSFDTTCDTIACETNFASYVDASGNHNSENKDFISSVSVASTSTFTVNFNASVFISPPSCVITTADGSGATTNGSVVTILSSTTTSLIYRTNRHDATAVAYPVFIHCDRTATDYTAAINAQKAFQKSKVSSFSSTNADTDWASCGLTGSALTGFGTAVPTPELQCKRQGSDLLMKGKFTAGTTPTAVEARLNLPIWNGVQLTSASTGKIPSIQLAGFAGISASSAASFYTLIEPSVTYMTFSFQSAANNTLLKQNANAFVTTGTIVTLHARIPINGWENSNIIIGQFNGLESCTDSYECTDTFSAKVNSAGVVSAENIDWISGNCSGGSPYTCTFNTSVFTVAPNCVAEIFSASNQTQTQITSTSASTAVIRTENSSSAVAANIAFNLICQKQGVDYIGKTAKAVASDQNVASPGTLKATLCSAKISSTGVITDQKGGCFASCTNATTPVCTFTASYWVSGQIPNCWHVTNGWITGPKTTTSTTFQGIAWSTSAVAQSGDREYFCHGERQ